MEYPKKFIAASVERTTRETAVPNPYFRKTVTLSAPKSMSISICGLGFYRLYINGKEVTKGLLAPYISNPDHYIYCDCYDVTKQLKDGKNVIAVFLGNGFLNNPGGYVWDFDKAPWMMAPCFSMKVTMSDSNGETELESDESFKTANSPLVYEDFRQGEVYDAHKEIIGWNSVDFDDSGWKNAISVNPPRGEIRQSIAPCIKSYETIKPTAITKCKNGYIYDFGLNQSGLCTIKVDGEDGQQIDMYHIEHIFSDGEPDLFNIRCGNEVIVQKCSYICKGEKGEEHTTQFTYYGYRYVYVEGLKESQATPEALTYTVVHADVEPVGDFKCSDETTNALVESVKRSFLSNLMYFPTDCPHREKNGWTGDAAITAEYGLVYYDIEKLYREWLNNIRKSMRESGMLPGIVPTDSWGYVWGNGPAWDRVLIFLPYYCYIYNHDKTVLEENATAIFRYLRFVNTLIEDDGLVYAGLGDWCQSWRSAGEPTTPIEVSSTLVCMDMAEKAAYIFNELGLAEERDYAEALRQKLRTAARERIVDLSTMTVFGSSQGSQCMGIAYGLFEDAEKPEAFRRLIDFIVDRERHFDIGFLSSKHLFHVLSEFGFSELAFDLINAETFPSFAYSLAQGDTALGEDFREDYDVVASRNHPAFGDFIHWYIRYIAGINYNPHRRGGECDIRPSFIEKLTFAEGYHNAPEGKIKTRWERKDDGVILTVECPDCLKGRIILEDGCRFDDGMTGMSVLPLKSGEYKITLN